MNWFTTFLTSSLGKKIVMGLTGIFLIVFLVVHCSVNALIFFNDSGESFNEAAHFMGTNILVRTAEIGLFAGLLLHIVQGLMLWRQNTEKRPVKYAVSPGNATSKWYSRSMGLLGTLILFFLIVHMIHFWVPSRFGGLEEVPGAGMHNLYAKMQEVFQELWVVVLYVIAVISLGYHLLHGFSSAFQTFGLNRHKYIGLISMLGTAFSIIVPFVFALMPILMYLKIID
jgi:succinate dehydrogenase / fumarate reductase cytochrome b subunit